MKHTSVAIALAKRFAYFVGAVAGRLTLAAAQQVDAPGLRMTEGYEACRLTAYRDSVGVLTIGWGHTGHDVYEGLTITPARAEELLREDLIVAEMAVNHDVHVPLTQNQFDALTDLVFNIGIGNFDTSTLLRKLNAGDYEGAVEEFAKWNHADGVVLAGLTRRRAAEAELFRRPDNVVDLQASGDELLDDRIRRVILEDFAEDGPIRKALEGWQE